MKHILTLGLAILLFSCETDSKQTNDPVQQEIEYINYTNEENHFRMEYPSHWESIDTLSESYSVMALTEKNPDTNDVFNVTLNMIKLPNQGKSLVEIIQSNLDMIKEQRPDYEIGVKNLTSKNGIEMVLIKADMVERETELSSYSIFFVHEADFYNLSLMAETNEIDDYLDSFDRILNSFEWIDE